MPCRRAEPALVAVVQEAFVNDVSIRKVDRLVQQMGRRPRGARSLLERTLAIYEARLGTDHPTTASALENLAVLLGSRGGLKRAQALYLRILAVRETRLGNDHPGTVRSREALSRVEAKLDTDQ